MMKLIWYDVLQESNLDATLLCGVALRNGPETLVAADYNS